MNTATRPTTIRPRKPQRSNGSANSRDRRRQDAQSFGHRSQALVHAGNEPGTYAAELGYPGQPPYTRGIYASMHRGRTWTQRQLIGLGTPPDYNARLLDMIAQGTTAVSLIPCNSVFRGYDMDEVHAELLGTCGVVVNTVEHMDSASPAWIWPALPAP